MDWIGWHGLMLLRWLLDGCRSLLGLGLRGSRRLALAGRLLSDKTLLFSKPEWHRHDAFVLVPNTVALRYPLDTSAVVEFEGFFSLAIDRAADFYIFAGLYSTVLVVFDAARRHWASPPVGSSSVG